MATIRKVTVVQPELLRLTGYDLTALDLALSHAISNWDTNSEKNINSRGPFASSQQYMAAKELLSLVLQIKRDLGMEQD